MRLSIFSVSTLTGLLFCIQSVFAYDIYLTRHFEKQSQGKDPALTEQGIERANELATLLSSAGLKQVYSTDYRRTKMTAMPFVQKSGIDLQSYNPRELSVFAEQIKSVNQNSLIVGHSNTTPMLIHLLGGNAQSIDESEYGDLYKLTVDGDKVTTEIIHVPPVANRITTALKTRPITSHSSTLRMLFNGAEVGYSTHEFVQQGDIIKAIEYTSIPAMKIDATITLLFDAASLKTQSMRMTGTMGAPVDVDLKLAGEKVSGYSEMARQTYKPQGKIVIDRAWSKHTYKRTTVLMNMPHIQYSSTPSYFNWYNGYDDETKKITIQKTGEMTITVPAGTFQTDVVEVIGGAPSQVYYQDKLSYRVVKIDIPGMPWVYEKVE